MGGRGHSRVLVHPLPGTLLGGESKGLQGVLLLLWGPTRACGCLAGSVLLPPWWVLQGFGFEFSPSHPSHHPQI